MFRPHTAGLHQAIVSIYYTVYHRDQYQSDNRETNDKTKPFRNNFVTKTLLVFGKSYNYKIATNKMKQTNKTKQTTKMQTYVIHVIEQFL